MARFFVLGPLVLVLCLVLYTGTSAADPQTTLSTLTTSSNTSAVTTEDPQTTLSTPTTSSNTSAVTTEGTTKGLCQYSLLKGVKETVAHVVNISGSEEQTYTIRIKDKHNEIRAEQISNRTAFEIPFEWLKPCTEYTVSVDDCKLSGNNTFTSSENEETIPTTVVTSVTDNEVCLKGNFTGIQWDLTECVEITEQNSCASTHTVVLDTCNYTMNVALPPVKPKIQFNRTIPSQFEWTNNPETCMSTLEVVCTHDNRKDIVKYSLNESVSLLPKKHYTCTGEYRYETRLIKSDPLFIHIECDLENNAYFKDISNNSFHISWNAPEKDNCSNIIWSSYSATCHTSEKREAASLQSKCTQDKDDSTNCTITELQPFTTYTCKIIAKLDGHEYTLFSKNRKTFSAKPKFKSITVQMPSHNSVHIHCSNLTGPNDWNGDAGDFVAVIKYNGDPIKPPEKKTSCWFSFSDLHYLTTYDIEVTATNKQTDSMVIRKTITTNCENNLFLFQPT